MRVELFDGPVKTSPAMVEFVNQAVLRALDPCREAVREVRVSVIDLNGDKGGIDTECTVHAAMNWRGHSVVVAKHRAADFHEAVRGAVRKARRGILRITDRARERAA